MYKVIWVCLSVQQASKHPGRFLQQQQQQHLRGRMAEGFAGTNGPSYHLRHYEGHVTIYVVFASLMAASAGMIFGYDIGISGGVTSMDDFLQKFFPKVYRNEKRATSDNYCRFSSPTLQLFTSSLYIAGSAATFVASYVTKTHGRTASMLCGGVSFLFGAILNASAQNLAMLIIGRISLGAGIGFGSQAVPLYLSEISTPTWRGFFNVLFQLATTIGIFGANLINYATGKLVPNGWRISLGLAAIPAIVLTLGGILLPDSPNSLVERDKAEKGREVLEKIRGVKNVDTEFGDLLEVSRVAKSVKHPWINLFQAGYRPQLVMAVCLPAFQQLGGINAINFYAPVLFRTLGFGSDAALITAVILGSVKVTSSFISMLVVDRWGRRTLFIIGGIQMAICEICVAVIMKLKLGTHKNLDHSLAVAVVILICVFVAGFDWSWGPLAWLVPSEIFPLEIRSAAQSIVVASNYLFTFFIGQLFLTMFCALKSFTFVFFAAWVVFMTAFVLLMLPETKNIPLEEMRFIWANHWLWKNYVKTTTDNGRKTAADVENNAVKSATANSFPVP